MESLFYSEADSQMEMMKLDKLSGADEFDYLWNSIGEIEKSASHRRMSTVTSSTDSLLEHFSGGVTSSGIIPLTMNSSSALDTSSNSSTGSYSPDVSPIENKNFFSRVNNMAPSVPSSTPYS